MEKFALSMEDLGPRRAKREAADRIINIGAKRPSSATHEDSSRARKARKLFPGSKVEDVGISTQQAGRLLSHSRTPDVDVSAAGAGASAPTQELDPDRTTPHLDKDSEDVDPQFHRTPATKRSAPHANLTEREKKISATDMELKIAAEVRGVTRKNVPRNAFSSIYLRDFSAEAGPNLAANSVKEIGRGSWEEKEFWNRLCKVLSDKVRCLECTHILPLILY